MTSFDAPWLFLEAAECQILNFGSVQGLCVLVIERRADLRNFGMWKDNLISLAWNWKKPNTQISKLLIIYIEKATLGRMQTNLVTKANDKRNSNINYSADVISYQIHLTINYSRELGNWIYLTICLCLRDFVKINN